MARIWMSGFEAGSLGIFDSISGTPGANFAISSTQARTGTYSLYVAQNTTPPTYGAVLVAGDPTELYMRVAHYPTSTSSQSRQWGFIQIVGSDGTTHLHVVYDTPGKNIQVRRGAYDGTLLGSTTTATSINTWYCIELRIVIADSPNGIVQLKLDGTLEINETAVGTKNGGVGDIRHIFFGSTIYNRQQYGYFDDIAINDTTGSVNTL